MKKSNRPNKAFETRIQKILSVDIFAVNSAKAYQLQIYIFKGQV